MVFFRFQEFCPNSDLKSSNGSVPRRSNVSTQVFDAEFEAAVDEDAPLESAAPRPTMPAKPLTKTSMADVYAFMFGEDPPDSV
mgnify:CR=1 FL=1